MNATTQITIPARRYAKCPTHSCVIVPVPASQADLFPDLGFAAEVVVQCAECNARDAARLAADEERRQEAARAEEDAAEAA